MALHLRHNDYIERIVLFLPVLAVPVLALTVTISCARISRPNYSPGWSLYSGECFDSSELTCLSSDVDKQLRYELTSFNAYSGVLLSYIRSTKENDFMNVNMKPLESDSFWYPELYSDEAATSLLTGFFNAFNPLYLQFCEENNYDYSSQARQLVCMSALLQCEDGFHITANRPIFGESAGGNLSSHFKIHTRGIGKAFVRNIPFQIVKGENTMSLDERFRCGNMMPLGDFVIYTEEPFDGPVDITIEIPVKKVMYLSYLRDLKRDPNAQLQLVPMTLHAEFTLNNLN